MKILILTICIVASFQCLAQRTTTNIDKITGDTVVLTKLERIYSKVSFSGTAGEQLSVSVGKSRKGYTLIFKVQTGKTSIFSVDENSTCNIKLASGKVLDLKVSTESISRYLLSGYGSSGLVFLVLDESQINELTADMVDMIRISTSRGKFDYEIKQKNAGAIISHISAVKLTN